MGWYTKIDKKLGGILPGGAPRPKKTIKNDTTPPTKNGGGSSGGSSSQFSEERIARQQQTDKAIADWKAGKTTQEEAANIVKNIRRGGGSGSASNIAEQEAYAAAEIKAKALRQEIVRQQNIQQELARREQQKINLLKADLIKRGAYTETKTYKDSKTGNPVRMILTQKKNGGERVVEYTNMVTGEKRVYRYETPKGGGGAKRTGQLTTGGVSKAENEKVYKDLKDAGLTPGTNRFGQVTEFHSKVTMERYPYTDTGIAKYNADIEKLNAKNNAIYDSMGGVEKLALSLTTKKDNAILAINNGSNSGETERYEKLLKKMKNEKLTSVEIVEFKKLQNSILKNYKNASNVAGITIALSLINLGLGSVGLVKSLYKDPIGTISKLPSNILNGLKNDYKRFKGSPIERTEVVFEYLTIAVAFKEVGAVAKSAIRNLNKILPGYVKQVNGKWVLIKKPAETFTVRGSQRYLKRRVQPFSIKRPFSSVADFIKGRKPGQFAAFTKNPGLILEKSSVKTGSTALREQVRLAGKEVTAVNAAADQLTSWLKRKKIIRKPIPGEVKFPVRIKAILKKFDTGKKISTKEFAEVNLWLQKNVAPNITLLERSLYLDPSLGLRVSRLGIQAEKRATLKDILRGNFRLWGKSQKPQVLIFENAKIAKFPKYLKDIERKLKSGGQLTTKEVNRLIKWQVESGSGKFKPIGSTIYAGGKELEITLAPGEMIRRIKQIGFTYIDGKKVTFVTAEVFKPTRAILKQIKLANLGKLTKNQLVKLEKFMSKKLGRKIKIETPALRKTLARAGRRADSSIPVLRVRSGGLFVLRIVGIQRRMITRKPIIRKTISRKSAGRIPAKKIPVKRTPIRKTTKRTTIRKSTKRTTIKRTTPRRPVKRKTPRRPVVKRPPRRPPIRPPKRPPIRPPKKPPVIPIIPLPILGKFTKRKVPSQQTYYVVEKVRGKFKKLYPKPLTAKDAKDYAVYSIDNRLSKTAFFIPMGKAKKVVSPPKQIQNYYSKNNYKVRPYKIRYGKKRQMVNGFIEKRKYFNDTAGERGQLRNIQKSPVKRRPISPARRRQLIKQLQKARAARISGIPQRRNVIKRKPMSPARRRQLIQQLKRARKIRMRNLRK